MKIQITIFLTIIAVLSFSCFGDKEDPLEKERKELNEQLEDNTALTIYRGIKISLRSLPLDKNIKNIDSLMSGLEDNKSESENIQAYTLHLIGSIFEAGNEKKKLNVKDALAIIKIYSKLKKELKKTDEDNFPTLLEVIMYINDLKHSDSTDLIEILKWNNSKEHLVLSAILMAAKPLPPSLQLYELTKMDPDKLEKTEIKPISGMLKGIAFMMNKWYYLSEEALGQSLYSLENDNIKFEFENMPVLYEGTKVDSYESQIAQLHALSSLLRGYVRTKMKDEEKNELAIADFEVFLKDAETIGLDNELTWFAGAYVHISKEDGEKAIPYLDKLRGTEHFTDTEREAIDDVKKYVADRKSDKALNVIYDKLFIGKIVAGYLYNYFVQIDWYKTINDSKAGKQFLELPVVIESEITKFEKGMDTDNLKEKGQELIDDIF